MASPELNPFAKANACQNCVSPGINPNENARLSCRLPLPNGDGSNSDTGTGLRKVVSDWISGGATKNTVLTTYGPIEDWNVSHVTSLAYLFYNMNTGNPDISKWNTGAVTDMGYSKFFID